MSIENEIEISGNNLRGPTRSEFLRIDSSVKSARCPVHKFHKQSTTVKCYLKQLSGWKMASFHLCLTFYSQYWLIGS